MAATCRSGYHHTRSTTGILASSSSQAIRQAVVRAGQNRGLAPFLLRGAGCPILPRTERHGGSGRRDVIIGVGRRSIHDRNAILADGLAGGSRTALVTGRWTRGPPFRERPSSHGWDCPVAPGERLDN